MRYFSQQTENALPQEMREVLEKYFPTNDYGVGLVANNAKEDIDLISIDRCKDECDGGTTWTHYANLQRTDKNGWEINEQFKGDREDEMWIYGIYSSFGRAVRNLATQGTANRKPIQIY